MKSVLDPQTKKRVGRFKLFLPYALRYIESLLEITIQRVKNLSPEEIARKILQCDPEVCTQVFLTGLKSVLPSPEEVGKLNVYRNSTAAELNDLHSSDRLMVELIKIERLGPRIEGMLYRITFDETIEVLTDVSLQFIKNVLCANQSHILNRASRSFSKLAKPCKMQPNSRNF